MVNKVIGEGSYGCVHKPSLHCSTPIDGIDYEKSVSKFMKKDDAETELKDFVIMTFLDKSNKYHLGLPKICNPNYEDPSILNDISKCEYFNKSDVKNHPDDYKLLILKYGGPDLKNFCMNYLSEYLGKGDNRIKKSKIFWKEVCHLIEGLAFFKKNKIIHYDIKPQNILYNPITNKMVYIDFGFMIMKEDLTRECLSSDNRLGTFHWSYPFDNGFINLNKLKSYKNSNEKKKQKFQKELTDLIVYNSEKNTLDISIRKPQAFKLLFSYIDPYEEEPSEKIQQNYIDSFFDGFNEYIQTENEENVINHSIDTIDIFCLGFSLKYTLNKFHLENVLTEEFYDKCSKLFSSMYDFNPVTREMSPEKILEEYKYILEEYTKEKNNNIESSIESNSESSKHSRTKSLSSSKYYNNLANLDATDVPLFHSKSKGKSKSKSNSNSKSRKRSQSRSISRKRKHNYVGGKYRTRRRR